MASMRVPNGGDVRRMAGSGEPVMHRRTNPASLHRRIAWPVMSRDQEKQAIAAHDGLLEASIDCAPCAVEAHPMEVEDAIRLNRARAKNFVPASVKRALRQRSRGAMRRRRPRCHGQAMANRFYCNFRFLRIVLRARQGANS